MRDSQPTQPSPASWWTRARRWGGAFRHGVHAVPGGRTALKLTIAALGAAVVALGLILVPLPGPGWAIVIGGLAIWAIEFVWARRLLDWLRRQLRAWARWVRRLPWALRIAMSVVVLAGLLTVGWLWIKHRYGFETAAELWEYITTH